MNPPKRRMPTLAIASENALPPTKMASLLAIFVGGSAFSLAIASVGILLFGGFILYDTSRMLRDPTNRDAVGAAIGLYLNFLNLFIFLLRILSSSRRDS